ncbi:hypothetical protein [Streptomyces sp. NBC_00233]|uniref:hypothetical protein n=1 Tax=Streptomyces sp. NBC_00233 TaxID=2975686 RepID=UPI00224D4E2A|nr:hypothetical protein [Streptomyces sp. NBC_00233]MCX5232981.1 hypothetical protein [Streptomyces sp. NBC_00233]
MIHVMRIVMQPARRSEKDVEQHYQDTIVRPVVFDDHADILDASVAEQLKQLFPGGHAQMWGVVPGKRDVNVSRISKMRPGDWVFFSGDKRVYFGGTIALMWRSKELATRLWGTDHAGSTWEYMYALSGTRGFDIPVEEVRTLLGWNPKRNIMGISVLGEEDSDTLRSFLTLDTAAAALGPAPATDEAAADEAAVAAYGGELERTAQRAQRGEQAALKRRLLNGRSGQCALCGRSLPGSFLIAAHIKKRAMCSDDEKRDLANIAMLACTLGCDAVFEHGYVTVAAGGTIQISPLTGEVPEIGAYIHHQLDGRTVTWWTPNREPYFHWHRTHTYKDAPPA